MGGDNEGVVYALRAADLQVVMRRKDLHDCPVTSIDISRNNEVSPPPTPSGLSLGWHQLSGRHDLKSTTERAMPKRNKLLVAPTQSVVFYRNRREKVHDHVPLKKGMKLVGFHILEDSGPG